MQIPGHRWKSLGIGLFNTLSKWFFKVDTPGSAGGHSQRWGFQDAQRNCGPWGGWGARKWGVRLSEAPPDGVLTAPSTAFCPDGIFRVTSTRVSFATEGAGLGEQGPA